jgi:hypothetical protein
MLTPELTKASEGIFAAERRLNLRPWAGMESDL